MGKLIYGDCLEEMKNIPDSSVDMILTDPPYGTTACKWDSVIPFDKMWERLNKLIKPNGAIVMTASQPFTTTLISSNMKMFRYCWVWEKPTPTGYLNAKKMPMRAHEDVVVFYSKLPTYNPIMTHGHTRKISTLTHKRNCIETECYGKHEYISYDSTDRYPRSVIMIATDKQKSKLHPTQKPVELMEFFIKTYTNEGETVVDFAMGSGTTGVACKKLSRNFIGIEVDKLIFAIAKERIDNI